MPVPVEQEVIKIPKAAYGVAEGSLAIYNDKLTTVTWNTCREVFHRAVAKAKTRPWLYYTSNMTQVISFIAEAENRIGLKDSQRCTFRPTSLKNASYIDPGPWWREQSMRLSFLSILLRVGRQYHGDFVNALYSQGYTTTTKPAVDRFLSGYTKYVGSGGMWQAVFSTYNSKPKLNYAETTLVKEDSKDVSEKSLGEARQILAAKGRSRSKSLLENLIAAALDRAFEEGLNSAGKVKPKAVEGTSTP